MSCVLSDGWPCAVLCAFCQLWDAGDHSLLLPYSAPPLFFLTWLTDFFVLCCDYCCSLFFLWTRCLEKLYVIVLIPHWWRYMLFFYLFYCYLHFMPTFLFLLHLYDLNILIKNFFRSRLHYPIVAHLLLLRCLGKWYKLGIVIHHKWFYTVKEEKSCSWYERLWKQTQNYTLWKFLSR